jgi:hypothetical protein
MQMNNEQVYRIAVVHCSLFITLSKMSLPFLMVSGRPHPTHGS